MSKSFRKDLTGQRFGRLKVISFVPTEDSSGHWKCQCDCGKEAIVRQSHLIAGVTKSCGCLRKEVTKLTGIVSKHNLTKTRIYHIWDGMKQRCYNQNCKDYNHYGRRGITVCDSWKNSFTMFRDWAMANGYREDLSIDRIDNDKGYAPENCRWTDKKTQNRNKRNNIIVEYKGQKMGLSYIAEKSGIPISVLYSRYYNGDRGERLFRPVEK